MYRIFSYILTIIIFRFSQLPPKIILYDFFFLNKTSNQVPSSTFGCHSFLFSIKSNILAFLFCLNFHDADILEKPSQWSCKQAEFWMCLIFFFLVRFKLNIWGWRARILLKKIWIKARCHISWERVMNAKGPWGIGIILEKGHNCSPLVPQTEAVSCGSL